MYQVLYFLIIQISLWSLTFWYMKPSNKDGEQQFSLGIQNKITTSLNLTLFLLARASGHPKPTGSSRSSKGSAAAAALGAPAVIPFVPARGTNTRPLRCFRWSCHKDKFQAENKLQIIAALSGSSVEPNLKGVSRVSAWTWLLVWGLKTRTSQIPVLEREVTCATDNRVWFHKLQISSALKHAASDVVVCVQHILTQAQNNHPVKIQ